MNKIIKFIVAISAVLLFASPVSQTIASIVHDAPLVLLPAVAAITYVSFNKLIADLKNPFVLRAVEVEIWGDYIMSNLFKGWSFIKRSFDASKYVLVGKVVHIPQAGQKPAVVKNRGTLPAVAVKRNDTDVLYALDEYTTDPVIIEDAANVQLSYDKMDDVLGDHTGVLNEACCDNLLIAWAPATASNILRSTGTLAATNCYMPLATGSRRAYLSTDLKRAMILMNKNKVPKQGRVAVMTEDAWNQIEEELRINNSREFSRYVNASEGTLDNAKGDSIGRLYGFDIYTTPNTVVYDNSATPVVKAYGAIGAAADNDAILCWHERMVERSLGEVKFFGQEQAPLYYGDVYSALVRAGGRKRYNNETGVYAIVQAAV
jgi:hypothetical protein